MTDSPQDQADDVSLEIELANTDADREIDKAVRGRRGVARRYVKWVRRWHPDASPAEIIRLIERHYIAAVTVAGAAIAVGGFAAEVAIAAIPGGGPAAAGGKQAAQAAGKQAAKAAAKAAALGVARTGSRRVAAKVLPAGDKQLQFEITAIFALALADIHGQELDKDQAHALVYGLANDRVSQDQIATMAGVLAESSDQKDWGNWANTLANALPGDAAKSLLRGVQTGHLEEIRGGLGRKQQAAFEYGAGAVVGGVTRFVFGREVVTAARSAFSAPPESFPRHLTVPPKAKGTTGSGEPNRALASLKSAANAVGSGANSGAAAVGSRVSTSAGVVGSAIVRAARGIGRVVRRPFTRDR